MGYEVSGQDREILRELAKKQLKGRMLLAAIAKKEGIAATEEDFDREIEKLTIRYPLGREEVKRGYTLTIDTLHSYYGKCSALFSSHLI